MHRCPLRASQPAAWVRPIQLILLFAGVFLLGCAGFILIQAYLYQRHEDEAFERRLQKHDAQLKAQHPLPVISVPIQSPPIQGEPIARIEIPSMGLDALVLPGDDAKTLRLGAGHIPGTALPGQAGNVGIAGHRDTFFRCLHDIRKDDEITLRTAEGTYHYRVETLTVVAPSQVAVLGPTVDNTLTLVTCYPFRFVGAAPKRFIVHARQVPASTRASSVHRMVTSG